jgi:hypothetical protein
MKRLLCLAAAVAAALALSAPPAYASIPWPNGHVNAAAKTVTLEYGQQLYDGPVVEGFPTGGYADLWIDSSFVRISTPEAANALLTESQTRNAHVRVSIPRKDIDASGRLLVRHGLAIGSVTQSPGRLVVSGVVKPSSPHTVRVSMQKSFFGFWRDHESVSARTDSSGAFTATFAGRFKAGKYRVQARVAGDSQNAAKSAWTSCTVSQPDPEPRHNRWFPWFR